MQKMLNSQPAFRWQQQNMDSLLYCGAICIATLRFCGRNNGLEHYRIENAAFPDLLSEVGCAWRNNRPFDLQGKTFQTVAEIVEQLYVTIFDRLDFTLTLA